MAIYSFIESFKSLLVDGRKRFIRSLLERKEEIPTPISKEILEENVPAPISAVSDNITTISGYNQTLSSIAADLGSLFSESNNLWRHVNNLKYLIKQELNTLKLSIEDLESKIVLKNLLTNSHTDIVTETFNAQSRVETAKKFYEYGKKLRSYIDIEDSLLKLPVDGEFIYKLSKSGALPGHIYLDRITGIPVSDGNPVNLAFDGSPYSFWNEVIHSTSQIYCSFNQSPWLPVSDSPNKGYKGGAACRIKIEFPNITQVSEIDIRPFGEHPINLLAIGWTNREENKLSDPTFAFGIQNTPSSHWWKDSINRGSIDLYESSGPNNERAVRIATETASGWAYLSHGHFDVSVDQGLLVEFNLKSLTLSPVTVMMTFISSGGEVLEDKTEVVIPESIGWTPVSISFDPVIGTEKVIFRIGVDPSTERAADVWVSDIFVEVIKEYILYEKIDVRKTVFLKTPINSKNLFLVFSQENYRFIHYSLNKKPIPRWDRLSRLQSFPEAVLGWEIKTHRLKDGEEMYVSMSSQDRSISRQIEGTSWQILDDLERTAFPDEYQYDAPVFEYQIGAFEIYLRHREYAPSSRYVSPPIEVAGEIREIRLESEDSVKKEITDPDSIRYSLTLFEDDPPEKGIEILNSLSTKSDYSGLPKPVENIPYQDYSTWTYSSSAFKAVYWEVGDYTSEVSDILLVQIGADSEPGMFIQKNLQESIDMRGAKGIVGEFYLFTPRQQRLPNEFYFTISFSSDGVNWGISKQLSGRFSQVYEIENNALVFIPFILNITDIPVALKEINHIRITIDSPTFYSHKVWLMVRRLKTSGWITGSRSIVLCPADDVLNSEDKVVVPVKSIVEKINGTDRNGRANLKYYPYVSKNKIINLIQSASGIDSLSTSLDGRKIPFDPNAEYPKYRDSSGNLKILDGYRPIKVSLMFPETGVVVPPDYVGKPKKIDFIKVENEILTAVESIQVIKNTAEITKIKVDSNKEKTHKVRARPSLQEQTVTTKVETWQTKYKNIVYSGAGVNFNAKWSNGISSGDVSIDPLKIIVDPKSGVVKILQDPPTPSHTLVKATYWYEIEEESPREEFFGYPVSGSVSIASPQKYPVTRNMTDYLSGNIPKLRPPVLDPLDSNYYPVYEYYVHPDGYLVFSQNMHAYSDSPAVITVEYETLAIKPRVSIDFKRPSNTNKTPFVDSYKLLLNVRRG